MTSIQQGGLLSHSITQQCPTNKTASSHTNPFMAPQGVDCAYFGATIQTDPELETELEALLQPGTLKINFSNSADNLINKKVINTSDIIQLVETGHLKTSTDENNEVERSTLIRLTDSLAKGMNGQGSRITLNGAPNGTVLGRLIELDKETSPKLFEYLSELDKPVSKGLLENTLDKFIKSQDKNTATTKLLQFLHDHLDKIGYRERIKGYDPSIYINNYTPCLYVKKEDVTSHQ